MPRHAMPCHIKSKPAPSKKTSKKKGGKGVKSPQGKNQHVSPQVNILLFLPFNMYNKTPNPQTLPAKQTAPHPPKSLAFPQKHPHAPSLPAIKTRIGHGSLGQQNGGPGRGAGTREFREREVEGVPLQDRVPDGLHDARHRAIRSISVGPALEDGERDDVGARQIQRRRPPPSSSSSGCSSSSSSSISSRSSSEPEREPTRLAGVGVVEAEVEDGRGVGRHLDVQRVVGAVRRVRVAQVREDDLLRPDLDAAGARRRRDRGRDRRRAGDARFRGLLAARRERGGGRWALWSGRRRRSGQSSRRRGRRCRCPRRRGRRVRRSRSGTSSSSSSAWTHAAPGTSRRRAIIGLDRDFVTLVAVRAEVDVDLVALSRRTLVEDGLAVERQGAVAADLEAVVRQLVLVALECEGRS